MRPLLILNKGAMDFRQVDIDEQCPGAPLRLLSGSAPATSVSKVIVHSVTDSAGPVPVSAGIASDWTDATTSIEIGYALTWSYGLMKSVLHHDDRMRLYATRSFIALDYETQAKKPDLKLEKCARLLQGAIVSSGPEPTDPDTPVLPVFWRQSPGRSVSSHQRLSLNKTIENELPLLLSAIPAASGAPIFIT